MKNTEFFEKYGILKNTEFLKKQGILKNTEFLKKHVLAIYVQVKNDITNNIKVPYITVLSLPKTSSFSNKSS